MRKCLGSSSFWLAALLLGAACGSGSSSGGKGGAAGSTARGGSGGGAAGRGGASGASGGGGAGGSAGAAGGRGGGAGGGGAAGSGGGVGGGGSSGAGGAGGKGGAAGVGGTAGNATGGAGGGTGGTGGCADNLMTSATNCGACGHDCTIAGATCASGLCTAGQVYGIADLPFGTDNSAARSVVFDAASASMYWAGFNNYSVRRYPLDGSGAKVVWQPATAATAGIESLAVTGGNAYWSIGAVGGSPAIVYSKPVGADPTVAPTMAFTPAARASYLRVQGGYFYWATGDYQDPSAPAMGLVYRRQIAAASSDAGTAIVSVDQGNFANFKALDVTTDAVYWVSDAGQGTAYELRTTPLAGGTPTAVPKIAGAADTAIAQSGVAPQLLPEGGTLYFSRTVAATPALNGIYRYTTGDAAPTLVVAADGVTSLIADANNVYFLRQNVNDVFKAPLAGGAAAVPIASASGTKLVAQDATYVYLLQSGCCQSSLLKALK